MGVRLWLSSGGLLSRRSAFLKLRFRIWCSCLQQGGVCAFLETTFYVMFFYDLEEGAISAAAGALR